MEIARQRSRSKAVTAVGRTPIIVEAKPGEPGAPATFLTTPMNVRQFTDKDFGTTFRRLRADEKMHLSALIELMQAWQIGDSLAIEKTRERVRQALGDRRGYDKKVGFKQGGDSNQEFARFLVSLFGLTPGQEAQAREIWDGYALSPREKQDPRWLLSCQLSDQLIGARLVIWWTGTRFLPALFCMSYQQALYIQALLRFVAGKGLAVCPHCGEPFIQDRSDQQYCSMAHREAHRVARWRAMNRTRVKLRKRKLRRRR